jgi:hypothetical protein
MRALRRRIAAVMPLVLVTSLLTVTSEPRPA